MCAQRLVFSEFSSDSETCLLYTIRHLVNSIALHRFRCSGCYSFYFMLLLAFYLAQAIGLKGDRFIYLFMEQRTMNMECAVILMCCTPSLVGKLSSANTEFTGLRYRLELHSKHFM